MKLIDTKHANLLSTALDAYAMRQKAIAGNVANIETPGYRRQEVQFEEMLQKAEKLQSSRSRIMAQIDPKAVETEEKPTLETEMMALADNQIRVQLVTRALRNHFTTLRTAIVGRSGQN